MESRRVPGGARHASARVRDVVACLSLTLAITSQVAVAESPERRALARAASWADVPPHIRVHLVDPDLAPDPSAIDRLDAFVVREPDGHLRPVVYLNVRAPLVRQGLHGSDDDLHVVAAVIVHEVLHLQGANEQAARRGERAYIEGMVRRGRLPPDVAARYLDVLAAPGRDVAH